mgnify:FL=1
MEAKDHQKEQREAEAITRSFIDLLLALPTLPSSEREQLTGLYDVLQYDGPGVPFRECVYYFGLYGDRLLPDEIKQEVLSGYESTRVAWEQSGVSVYQEILEEYEDLLKSQEAIRARTAA